VIACRQQPLYGDYLRMLEQGVKPPLAKLTVARKIASTALVMWKKQEEYDPSPSPKPRVNARLSVMRVNQRDSSPGRRANPSRARFEGKYQLMLWAMATRLSPPK